MRRLINIATTVALLSAGISGYAADAPPTTASVPLGSTQSLAKFTCDASQDAPTWSRKLREEIAEEDDTADATTVLCLSEVGQVEREQIYAVYLQGPLWCDAMGRCTLRLYNQKPRGELYQSFKDKQIDLALTADKSTDKLGLLFDKDGTAIGIRIGAQKLMANPHFFVEAK